MRTETEKAAAKNRAQQIRDMVEIRLAVNEAGPGIATVLRENGIDIPGADWSKVFPHWLIACVDDIVIGCCQIAISTPVGYVEFMFVRPEVPPKLKAVALRKLIIQSMATLHAAGCQMVGGVVARKNSKFANVLENLGFLRTYGADVYAKRLT